MDKGLGLEWVVPTITQDDQWIHVAVGNPDSPTDLFVSRLVEIHYQLTVELAVLEAGFWTSVLDLLPR